MGATEEFSRFLAQITTATIPEAAFAAARRLLLDGIGVAFAGSLERASGILGDHVRSLGGEKHATALNFGFETSTVSAAYLNGATMHVLDYEPMWNPPSHALSTTLPAALALGESLRASGKEILAALIKGVEAHGRLRVASRQYEPRELVFHPPGVAGPIGGAVAAAHLLDLDVTELRNAMGIAASRAGSLLANVGTMTKCTHCGNAAAAGLEAAQLASRGLSANPDVIEAPNGLAAAFFDANWEAKALTIVGAPLRIIEPGFAIKMFPSQFATHFVILAALDARSRLPSPDDIAAVEIAGPIMPYVDRPRPLTGLDAKFSFQYTAASALVDGAVGVSTFTDGNCARADIDAMLKKVRFAQLPEIPATLDRMWIEVKITLDNGQVVTGKCVRPPGLWGTPISEERHLAKVRDCFRMVLGESDTEELIDTLQQFDTLSGSEVRGLMHTLGRF
ncbi:MAG TPA: MmgE/PrpD family protein [Candidatus Binataceae bacterium]|nr:MmgE/PrpD family protein [Candidatus Binataceae bacterium]